MYKKIELIANVAIIALAVLVGAVLVQKFFFSKNVPSGTARPTIAVGSKLDLPGVDWAQNHKTLVLALQKGCHFCSESAPFYQRLVQGAAAKNVKLVAVLPQNLADSREYLNTLALPVIEIRQAQLGSLNVSGTPTLILVDDKGQVAASWTGKLPTDKESEVLARL